MTERELIDGCIKKKLKCQRTLFEQFAGKMMSICLRYGSDQKEAEDILQESFIRIFSFIGQYKFEGSLEGWVKRIVIRCALRTQQKKRIRFAEIDENVAETLSVDSDAIARLGADELIRLISGLPDGYRLVFNLYVLEGFDHNEIAQMLQINATTSRSQLSKARKILKIKIEAIQKLPNGYVRE